MPMNRKTLRWTKFYHIRTRWRFCRVNLMNFSWILKLLLYIRMCSYEYLKRIYKILCVCIYKCLYRRMFLLVCKWENLMLGVSSTLCFGTSLAWSRAERLERRRVGGQDGAIVPAQFRAYYFNFGQRMIWELAYQCVEDCSSNLLVSLCSFNAFLKCHFVSVKCSRKILKYF